MTADGDGERERIITAEVPQKNEALSFGHMSDDQIWCSDDWSLIIGGWSSTQVGMKWDEHHAAGWNRQHSGGMNYREPIILPMWVTSFHARCTGLKTDGWTRPWYVISQIQTVAHRPKTERQRERGSHLEENSSKWASKLSHLTGNRSHTW